MFELAIALLLPFAAYSGWRIGVQQKKREIECPDAELSDSYFQGMNFAVSGQSEQAISALVDAASRHPSSSDIPIALGNLYRRSGEVSRAISIHSGLIENSSLNSRQRADAVYALALDYQKAGLFERAEDLLEKLLSITHYQKLSLERLLDISLSVKDWDKAIEIAEKLRGHPGMQPEAVIAQCYCEIAEQKRLAGDLNEAIHLCSKAIAHNPMCARANVIKAQAAMGLNQMRDAIGYFKEIENQDIAILTIILPKLKDCYISINNIDEFIEYLQEVSSRCHSSRPVILLAEMLLETKGLDSALSLLNDHQKAYPTLRGVERLIELEMTVTNRVTSESIFAMLALIRGLLKERPSYHCESCGFTGKILHWRCPSCRSWESVKPQFGIDS